MRDAHSKINHMHLMTNQGGSYRPLPLSCSTVHCTSTVGTARKATVEIFMRVRRTAKIIMRNTFGLLAFSAQREAPQQAVKNVNKRNLNASQCEDEGYRRATGGEAVVHTGPWSIGRASPFSAFFWCVQLIFDD